MTALYHRWLARTLSQQNVFLLKVCKNDTPLQGNLAIKDNTREIIELAIAWFHSDWLICCQEGLQVLWIAGGCTGKRVQDTNASFLFPSSALVAKGEESAQVLWLSHALATPHPFPQYHSQSPQSLVSSAVSCCLPLKREH